MSHEEFGTPLEYEKTRDEYRDDPMPYLRRGSQPVVGAAVVADAFLESGIPAEDVRIL